ncbi:glycosyltransferase [Planktothrix pseudagardhii]|nr:hypothetical protein [Planktothrix pseudagardhii]
MPHWQECLSGGVLSNADLAYNLQKRDHQLFMVCTQPQQPTMFQQIKSQMACRTPVIGVPSGAAPELLSDGIGILVKPEGPEDMAETIVKMCQMPQEQWCDRNINPTKKSRLYLG